MTQSTSYTQDQITSLKTLSQKVQEDYESQNFTQAINDALAYYHSQDSIQSPNPYRGYAIMAEYVQQNTGSGAVAIKEIGLACAKANVTYNDNFRASLASILTQSDQDTISQDPQQLPQLGEIADYHYLDFKQSGIDPSYWGGSTFIILHQDFTLGGASDAEKTSLDSQQYDAEQSANNKYVMTCFQHLTQATLHSPLSALYSLASPNIMKGTYTIVQTLAGLNYIKEQNSYSKISGSSTNSDGSTTISKGHIQGISFAGSIDNPGITASPDMYATMAFSSYSQSTQSTSANIFTYHWDADSTNNLNATTLTYDSQGNLLGGLIENEYGTGINYAYGYVQAPAENGQKIILTTGSGGAFTTSGSEFHVDGQEGVPLTLNGNSNTVIDTNPISDSGSTSSNISGIIINGSSDVIEATSNFQVTLSSHDTGASGAFGQDFLPTYMGGISFGSISQNSVCSVTAAIQNADGTITGYTGSLSKDENSNDSALISINEGYYSQNGVEFASESILSPTTSAPSQTNETVSLLDTTGAQKATESWYDDSTGNVNLSALFSDLNTSIQTESMEFIGKDSNAQVQSISIETKDGQNISVDLTSPTEWAASFYNPTANTSTSYMADGTNITKTDSSGTIIIGQDSAGSLASILPTGSLTSYSDAGGFWNNIVSDDKTFTLGTAQS